MADEYCGKNKVNAPSCDSSQKIQRVVGYYEGWAPRRSCHAFKPEQIPSGVYTHINFAFATIDPLTFSVRPASSGDVAYYKRLTALKELDPDLKVLIAIGGWTFNDPGPTATTFSDIARSEKNQQMFIKSLISFMTVYDFDGVDLDWEYPVTTERSGRKEDYANFPKFIANLKKALKSSGRDELSLTLPASYWYLQHFDIVRLEPYVDFFNMMTYDLHGTWDKPIKSIGPYLNAHTNLTEIEDTMTLLWRNKMDPEKIVLGTGFYGRAFTASSRDCLKPGCRYESGAPRQKCSNEVSVMMNSEIMDDKRQTQLEKKAAVKSLVFDDDNWVAYDDEETLKMKVDFAKKQCLSGVMVWAVSQDDEDGTFSKAIGKAAGRQFSESGPQPVTEDGLDEKETKHAQCKWTNCGQSCPSGWIHMLRKDDKARENEYMVDETGCFEGVHQLCCPPEGDTPTCGWYTHHNGKCKQKCPEGTFEIGSLNKHCRSNYQSACCSTGSSNTKLYDQCFWTEGPKCDKFACAPDLEKVASSSTGSGGATCDARNWGPETPDTLQERKYCCEKKGENQRWGDCKWYDNVGPGAPESYDSFCRSGCPNDRVRVAMDTFWNTEKGVGAGCLGGAKSKCCLPKSATITKRESPHDSTLRDALAAFVQRPICEIDKEIGGIGLGDGWSKRSLDFQEMPMGRSHNVHQHGHGNLFGRRSHHHGHSHSAALQERRDEKGAGTYDIQLIISLMYVLLQDKATLNQRTIWNDEVVPEFPSLEWGKLARFIQKMKMIATYGYHQLADLIVCNLADWNKMVSGKEENCECSTVYCCPGGGDYCSKGEIEDFDRRSVDPGPEKSSDTHGVAYRHLEDRAADDPLPGEPRPFTIRYPDGSTVIIRSQEYPPAGQRDWPAGHPIWTLVYIPANTPGCVDVYPIRITIASNVAGVNIEHIVELNTIARFLTAALASGAIREDLVTGTMLLDYNLPHLNGQTLTAFDNGVIPTEPLSRIFHTLGSRDNRGVFVLLNPGLNQVKTCIWRRDLNVRGCRYMQDGPMEDLLDDFNNNEEFLLVLREVITVINYLAADEVWSRLLHINRGLRREFDYLEQWEMSLLPPNQPRSQIVRAWNQFIANELRAMVNFARDYVETWVRNARNRYRGNNDKDVILFLARLSTLLRYALEMNLPIHELLN
ncbi:hypothetical protein NW767_014633 [Fusarium falciforme]|nr:hypothetical protein NW767_014633 [Fusarium falciforme]